jgi:hypothetical protein
MSIPIVSKIEQHASTLGSKGKIDVARLSLKFGKKIELATPPDEAKLRALAKEIFGKDF